MVVEGILQRCAEGKAAGMGGEIMKKIIKEANRLISYAESCLLLAQASPNKNYQIERALENMSQLREKLNELGAE